MQQLATFYNPVTTNYIQEADSNDDTIATSNLLGREGADAAKPDPEANSDMSLKTHDLQEDGSFDTSSKHMTWRKTFLSKHLLQLTTCQTLLSTCKTKCWCLQVKLRLWILRCL